MSLPGFNFLVLIQKLPPELKIDLFGIPVRTLSESVYCQNVPNPLGLVKTNSLSVLASFRVYLNLKDAPLGRSV